MFSPLFRLQALKLEERGKLYGDGYHAIAAQLRHINRSRALIIEKND
jgi:hypothetical protein